MIDSDLSTAYLWHDDGSMDSVELLSRGRFALGYKIMPRFAVLTGLSANVLVVMEQTAAQVTMMPAWVLKPGGWPQVALWPGLFMGVQI